MRISSFRLIAQEVLMRSLVPLVVVAMVAIAPACVTLGTHEELQQAHAQTKERLAGAELNAAAVEKKLQDTNRALAAEQGTGADLASRLSALQKKYDDDERALRAELEKHQGEVAHMIKDRSALKGSVEEMKQALEELAKRKAEADKRINEYRGLLARFKSLIDAGKLKVKIVDGRMVVGLASDILFASGSAALSKDGKQSLAQVGKLLAQIPDRKFQVEGHTDNVPIRTEQFPSNWGLASARAITVLKTMVDAGLPAARVSAASFADSKPATSNGTAEGKALNRRIEIVVVPDLSSLPGFEELQKAGS
jgi:chemotaxis protein MotB